VVLLTTLNSKYIQTSLALYTLQAYCRQEFPGIQIDEFNINQNLDWVLARIYQKRPKVLGLSTNIWNIHPHLELVHRLKQVLPETVVIFGGPEVSAEPREIMERAPVDFIVRGEGEETLLELLRYFLTGRGQPSVIRGLAYREGEGIVLTPERPLLPDLSVIPFPYEDLNLFHNRLVYYESSRGCRFSCTYCLSGWEAGRVRCLPVERVKADLTRLINAGIKTVKFVDRTFNFDRARALEILRFIKAEGGETQFHLEMVGELLDEEEIRVLNTAPPGRFRLEIGVQSTCTRTLKEIRRFHNLPKLKANISRLTAVGKVLTHLDLIAGLPYEDGNGLAASFDYVFRMRPDELQLGFLKLLKGSPLRARAGEYGYLYTKSPPYEVLGNRWLSYEEVIRIKLIEDLVEKVYNSHHFQYTVNYLFKNDTLSPWDFFRKLGQFWEGHDLTGRALKLSTLFDQIFSFFKTVQGELRLGEDELIALRDLLTLDFNLIQRGGKAPSWLRREDHDLRRSIYQTLYPSLARDYSETGDQTTISSLAGIPLTDWPRRVKVFMLGVDPESGEKKDTIILAHTPTQGDSAWHRLPASIFREEED